MELLKTTKTRFASYYLTFRRLLKVREALASMVSSESWQFLKDRATSTFDRLVFQEVEDTVLDGQFCASIKYVLQFTNPIYCMIRFADTDKLVIGEVYEQMDNMLGQIKDIVEQKDPILYDHIHTRGQKVGRSQRSTACISICINTKILFSILVFQNNNCGWG